MTFSEHQRAPRVMLWVLLGIGVVSIAFVVTTAIMFDYDQHRSVSVRDTIIPIVVQVIVLSTLWVVFWRSTLHISINEQGIDVRFTPFHRTPRSFAWTDVERVIVRKVDAFGEFGGWGIRWNFSKTIGYVWRGRHGLDLRMRDGRRVVVTIEDIARANDVIHAVVPTGVEYEQRIAELQR